MHSLLFPVSILCLVILLLVFLLKRLRQPYMVAYILAGLLLGPHTTGVFNNAGSIGALGEIGILLLMFFLGMEIEIPDKRSLLVVPIVVYAAKTSLSLVFALMCGQLLHWRMPSILLVTVLLTFNSTAVVSEFLRNKGELHSPTGKIVLNILLLQDILLAPVLILLRFLSNQRIDPVRMGAAIGGSVVIFLLLRAIRNRNLYQLPFLKELERDHDLQVFTGAFICLGCALLAAASGLTGPIGSFAAGIFIGRTKAFHWLGNVLRPFKVFFTALFFVSVGVSLDLDYLKSNWIYIISITLLLLITGSILSSLVFMMLRYPVKNSIYAGALLSQAGEFSILACSFAFSLGIIGIDFFKEIISITALSLLVSSFWMATVRKYMDVKFTLPK